MFPDLPPPTPEQIAENRQIYGLLTLEEAHTLIEPLLADTFEVKDNFPKLQKPK